MMEKSAASSASTGDATDVPKSSLSTLSSQSTNSLSVTDSTKSDAKTVAAPFDSKARDAGVKAVLEKRKEDKQKELNRLQKMVAEMSKLESDVKAACDKHLARHQLLTKNNKKSDSCPSSRSSSRGPSRNSSKTNVNTRNKKSISSEENKKVCPVNFASEKVQNRLCVIENKVDLIMEKLREMNVPNGITPSRKVSSYEASIHGCWEIQYLNTAAIEVLEKAVDTLHMLEGLPSVYANITSKNSLRHRYELQMLAAHLTNFVGRMKNSKVSYDKFLESEMINDNDTDDCIACPSNSELRFHNKQPY